MSADNRLTADQLAALAGGDTVTVESTNGWGRPRYAPGTVIRVEGPDIVVSVRSAGGVPYQERYRRRDGIRVGGLTRAELVDADGPEPGLGEVRRCFQRIDFLYREWARNRADGARLRRLHAAIAECLEGTSGDGSQSEEAAAVGNADNGT